MLCRFNTVLTCYTVKITFTPLIQIHSQLLAKIHLIT